MEKLSLLFIFILSFHSVIGQDCNIVLEDFESYDLDLGFLEQTNGTWIKMFPGASNPLFLNESVIDNNSLDINSLYSQGTGTGESELIQILNLDSPGIIDYKFEFYNECGILSLDFLESFTDTATFQSIKRVSFEILPSQASSDFGLIINQDTVQYCLPTQNEATAHHFRLDFNLQKFHVLCADAILYSFDFETDADKLFGIAYGSNQCNLYCISELDADNDGFQTIDDCDDNAPNVNPGMLEIPYNNIDDDCNIATLDDDLDQDGFSIAEDCDDSDININPSQTEVPYNNIDDDCNSATFDDDLDQDGFLLADDCDDNNPSINSGQTEVPYNNIDDDCNAATFDDDLDQDGFLVADDCDDNNPNINSSQAEVPYNNIDDDCNATTLDDDLDQDGFLLADDCDDNNPNINSSQAEVPYNNIDDDCNAATLDDDLDQDGFLLADDCDDNNPNINSSQAEVPYNNIDDDCNAATLDDDLDQDGFLVADDCDDNNPNINSSQTEVPYNNIDDDCNAATLDDDLDQDGFLLADDCDDTNPDINPSAVEIANNGIDENCDGMDLTSSFYELSNVKVNIYPNPVVNVINIFVDGNLSYKASLFDLSGKLITSSKNKNSIMVNTITPGTYLLEVADLNTNQKVVEKIIIAH